MPSELVEGGYRDSLGLRFVYEKQANSKGSYQVSARISNCLRSRFQEENGLLPSLIPRESSRSIYIEILAAAPWPSGPSGRLLPGCEAVLDRLIRSAF